jgi:hypothetical protein
MPRRKSEFDWATHTNPLFYACNWRGINLLITWHVNRNGFKWTGYIDACVIVEGRFLHHTMKTLQNQAKLRFVKMNQPQEIVNAPEI